MRFGGSMPNGKTTNGELLIRIDERLTNMQEDLVDVKKSCKKIPKIEINLTNHLTKHEKIDGRIWKLFLVVFASILSIGSVLLLYILGVG